MMDYEYCKTEARLGLGVKKNGAKRKRMRNDNHYKNMTNFAVVTIVNFDFKGSV